MTDDRKWFVIISRPRAEKQVSKRLANLGIENFLPLQKQLRVWHDRKKWVEIPLFFSYIFVKVEESKRNMVFDAGGVVKYLSLNGKMAVLSEAEINRVTLLCSYFGEVHIDQRNVKEGDEVEIINGHFLGLRGYVTQMNGRNMLRISIDGLCTSAIVDVDINCISKV